MDFYSQPDPVNPSLYHYAGNNPVKYTDPTGEYSWAQFKTDLLPVVNLDFGMDYAKSATQAWNNKDYFRAAVYELDVAVEMVIDFAAAYGVAKVAGAIVGTSVGATGTSVWSLDKFSRGWEIERRLGGMMNNFPTIDKFTKGENGIATSVTSIKSMDLTCKTYQNASNITRTLNNYIDKVANFSEGHMKGIDVVTSSTTQRILELAIPSGATTQQMQAIQKSIEYGKSIGVELDCVIMK